MAPGTAEIDVCASALRGYLASALRGYLASALRGYLASALRGYLASALRGYPGVGFAWLPWRRLCVATLAAAMRSAGAMTALRPRACQARLSVATLTTWRAS
jgi:hypothetical protein